MSCDPSFVYDEKDHIDTLLERLEPPNAQFRAVAFRANGKVVRRTKPGDLGTVKCYASSLRHHYHRIVIQRYEDEQEMWEDWSIVSHGGQRGGVMSEQDRLDAYSEGLDDGYDGHINANPYIPDSDYRPPKTGLWVAYEKGYREGVAEKKRVGND